MNNYDLKYFKWLVILGLVLWAVLATPTTKAQQQVSVQEPIRVLNIEAPSYFFDQQAEQWSLINSVLINKKDMFDRVIIRNSGVGGLVIEVAKTFYAIKEASKDKEIIIQLTGSAVSGSAYISCAATKVEFSPGSALVFHNARFDNIPLFFGMLRWKEIGGDDWNSKLVNSWLQECKSKGLLTDHDINMLNKDYEVYVTKENGEIRKSYHKETGWEDVKYGAINYLSGILFLFLIVPLGVFIVTKTIKRALK